MTLFDSYSWLCRRIDQKLLKYVSCSSFKWKQLLILSYLLKRTLVLLKVLPLSCIFAYTNLITHEFLYSSSSLLNESLLHDKLWGPSQRVVTLFHILKMLCFARNFDFDLIYNKDSFQNNLWGNSLREYYASNNSSSWVPFITYDRFLGGVSMTRNAMQAIDGLL